ncbi:MAG: hypothetical protein N3A38_13980, partial [Planctomycetota bacterium]|nr:hypothetical protein [Planctomycetota bacterium]
AEWVGCTVHDCTEYASPVRATPTGIEGMVSLSGTGNMGDLLSDKPIEVRTFYCVLGIKDETDLKRFCREFAKRTIEELNTATREHRGTRLLAREDLFAKYVEIRVWQGDVNFLRGAVSDWQRWNAHQTEASADHKGAELIGYGTTNG